jgi:diacylglycerol kinase family enzyme
VGGFLLINPRSGNADPSVDELRKQAAARRVDSHVLSEGEDAAELARTADAKSLGIAGGDGSLAPVAAVALERGLPFVCVPYGTRNHFARDLGLDRDDPLAALEAFSGVERRIDVGRANGQLFLNNVSLGLYAQLVHRRERHRRGSDALARLRALMLLVRERGREQALAISGNRVSASVVVVANNAYELDVFNVGERERIDEGLLHLYVARGLRPGTWEERSGEEFTIQNGARLRVAMDGEPAELESPARFSIEQHALRVLVPPG